jgi:hypothetical protein
VKKPKKKKIHKTEKVTCEICREFNIGTLGHLHIYKLLADLWLSAYKEALTPPKKETK